MASVVSLLVLAVAFVLLSAQKLKQKPKIYYLHVDSEIKYRFSKTVITSKVVNPSTSAQEALFDVTLPNEAFMTAFKLIVNDTEYDGKVKGKEEAKKEYEAAKSKGHTAGHIVAKPRETNKFQIQVNVAAAAKVTFKLTYRELLKRTKGTYEHVVHINPGQVVDDFRVEVNIKESRNLTSIKVPPLRNDTLTENEKDKNDMATIERVSPTEARISYAPSQDQQKAMSDQGISGQFVVQYDLDRKTDAGDLLVMDGYFVHFVAPEGLDPMPMDIVFVLDRSGSMSGTKMRQMKESMIKILDDVKEADRIMMIAFDDKLLFWRQELVSATKENIKEAKKFINNTFANGGTDINLGMTEGLKLLSKLTQESRAPVLVFLTDGQPTSGETRISTILSNIKKYNEARIPVFSLAFGRGADYDFVKKVAAQNNGMGRKIYEDSDAALQISGFYKEISTVLMRDVKFTYLDGALNESTVTKTKFNTYFKGSELVVAGKIEDLNKLQSGMEITSAGKMNRQLKLRYPPFTCIVLPPPRPLPPTTVNRNAEMMEKLWAYLTIKQLLTKKDALESDDEIKDIDDKIMNLSLKYQFVTPLTSMVVTLPDELKKDTVVRTDTDIVLQEMDTPFISRSYMYPPRMGMPGLSLPLGLVSKKRKTSARGRKGPGAMTQTMPPPPSTTVPSLPVKLPSKSAVPAFVINIQGILQPLCFDLPLKLYQTYQVLKVNATGKELEVEATWRSTGFRTSRKIKTFGSAEVESRDGNLGSAAVITHDPQRRNYSYKEAMEGVEISIVDSPIGLQVQASFNKKITVDLDGILSVFKNMKGKVTKEYKRGKRRMAKLKIRKGGSRIRMRTVKTSLWNGKECLRIKKRMIKLLNIALADYES